MQKRYQVFVSSTYQDLQDERKEVIQALLELDCIPSGMELFPAANEDQWTLIKKVIDDSDYYLVVVAGRYGSVASDGISFTEMEYKYALEKHKPIIGFLHKNPGEIPTSKSETDPDKLRRLDIFRSLVSSKMVKFWSSPAELGSVVSRSVIKLTRDNPAVGWVRADHLPDESSTEEILRLRNEIDSLNKVVAQSIIAPPLGTELLAKGKEELVFDYCWRWKVRDGYSMISLQAEAEWRKFKCTWDTIFFYLGPDFLDEGSTRSLRARLVGVIEGFTNNEREDWRALHEMEHDELTYSHTDVTTTALDTVILQFRALGYIKQSDKKRSLKDSNSYWTLTPYGDLELTKLRAIKRKTN